MCTGELRHFSPHCCVLLRSSFRHSPVQGVCSQLGFTPAFHHSEQHLLVGYEEKFLTRKSGAALAQAVRRVRLSEGSVVMEVFMNCGDVALGVMVSGDGLDLRL